VDLSNRLVELRNELFNEHETGQEAVRTGDAVVIVAPFDPNALTSNRRWSHRLAVIVADNVAHEEARERFGRARVFTVEEAKGLEFEHVFLWQFFDSDLNRWQSVGGDRSMPTPAAIRETRLMLSRLGVAITRARSTLAIVTAADPLPLHNLFGDYIRVAPDAEEICDVLNLKTSSLEEYAVFAEQCEERKLFDQAAANYQLAERLTDYHRCMALACEREDNWVGAGEHFAQAGLPDDAVRCFDKSGSLDRSIATLAAAGKGSGIEERYLAVDDRISKLPVSGALPVVPSVVSGSLPAAVLAAWVRRRSEHHRGEFQRTVQSSPFQIQGVGESAAKQLREEATLKTVGLEQLAQEVGKWLGK
jgi:hypothetical protein